MEVERRKAKLLTTQLSVLSSKRRTHEGLDSLVGLSVDAILSGELARPIKPQQHTNTLTLLDIISNEESGAAYRGLAELNGTGKHKKKSSSKKSIKDKLKFRKHGCSWSSSSSVPTSDLPSNNKKNRTIKKISDPVLVDRPLLASLSLRSSIKLLDDCQTSDLKSKSESSTDDDDDDGEKNVNTTTNEEKEKLEKQESVIHTESESLVDDENVSGPLITEPDEEPEDDEKRENKEGQLISESMMETGAPTVSLMALLEESGRIVDDDDNDDEDYEEEDDETGVEYICTLCMIKHRRLAFVPCGHTFCSLCSKELWVSRGNCPLCTGYILEILDIF